MEGEAGNYARHAELRRHEGFAHFSRNPEDRRRLKGGRRVQNSPRRTVAGTRIFHSPLIFFPVWRRWYQSQKCPYLL